MAIFNFLDAADAMVSSSYDDDEVGKRVRINARGSKIVSIYLKNNELLAFCIIINHKSS
jgi:hypothetical protein